MTHTSRSRKQRREAHQDIDPQTIQPRGLLKDISYRFPKIGVIKPQHIDNKRIRHLRTCKSQKNVLPKSPIQQGNSGHLPCGIFMPLYISLMLPPCELHSAFISCFQIRVPDPVAPRVRQVCFNHDRNKPQKTMFRTGTDSQLCSVQGPVLRLRSSLYKLLMSFLISIAVRKLRFGMVENPNLALDLLQSV